MKNTLLLTPGPVPIPNFVHEAIAKPVIHHRTSVFEAFYDELLSNFKYLFQTEKYVCSMMGSGTYGVEVAMYSLFRPENEILVVNNGKFSQRWADYGNLLGLKVTDLGKEWGRGVEPNEVLEAFEKMKTPKGVVLTHSETSTGGLIDLEEMAFSIRHIYPEMIIVVDAITSVGTIPFYFDEWQIDCAVVASQKALMNPAGTVAFALSERAEQTLINTHEADFRNLYNFLHWAKRKNYPYTPPVSLLFGLKAATDHIKSETLPKIWNKTHLAAKYFRNSIIELGGEIFAEKPSDSLTAFFIPSLNTTIMLNELENTFGLKLSGGQGELKGKIARISHMGMADIKAGRACINALTDLIYCID